MSRASDFNRTSKIIKNIDSNRDKYLIIHYSCESFFDKENGGSSKITSIAIRKLQDGQTDLFAIHKTAEFLKIPFEQIDTQFEQIEKVMLKDYFEFISRNNDKTWIHWNMRDSNFGFKAIEHRYKVLGENPVLIPDDKKIDLANLLSDRFSKNYVDNPKMINLYKINNIKPKDFLNGKQEAEAFNNKEYIKLSHSSASKVNLFSKFLTLIFNNELVVNTSKKYIYGTNIQGLWLCFTNWPYAKGILWLINTIFSALIGAWISSNF